MYILGISAFYHDSAAVFSRKATSSQLRRKSDSQERNMILTSLKTPFNIA